MPTAAFPAAEGGRTGAFAGRRDGSRLFRNTSGRDHGTERRILVEIAPQATRFASVQDERPAAAGIKGMQAGVAAVMINVTASMIGNVLKDRKLISLVMLLGASVAAVLFDVDIILIIIVCGAVGGVYAYLSSKHGGMAA